MSNNIFDINTIYAAQCENVAWLPAVRNGVTAGTEGSGLRMEAFTLKLEVPEGLDLGVRYRALISNLGWTDYVMMGEVCGTVGKSRQLEAIAIELIGADADKYDVFYQVHVSNKGWMNWMKNGDFAGTEGFALQAEGIRVMVFKKGVELRTDGVHGFVKYEAPAAADPVINTDMAGKYFSWVELECDCPKPEFNFGWCDGFPETVYPHSVNQDMINALDVIREVAGPIIVTSAIRCLPCNDHWGGIPGSYHTKGEAIDIVCPGMSPYDLAVLANSLTGVGARYYEIDGFVHIEPAGCGVYCQQAA